MGEHKPQNRLVGPGLPVGSRFPPRLGEGVPLGNQCQLSINHAVGRVIFEKAEDHRTYAHNVVNAERNGIAPPRLAVLYSVENGDATQPSSPNN